MSASQVRTLVEDAWRDYETDGVPASGVHEPVKSAIRYALGTVLEQTLAAIAQAMLRYDTVANMNANTAAANGTIAYVYRNNGSSSDAANGYYQRNTGAGTWEPSAWLVAAFAGLAPKTLDLTADRTTITHASGGALAPGTQTTTFTAAKQNTSATVGWTLRDGAGNPLTPVSTYLSADTGDSVTMTAAQFEAARGSTRAVSVTASYTDGGTTYTRSLSVGATFDGATGTTGGVGDPGAPGYKLFATYAALAATTSTANDAGIVQGPDAGTHTDPVTGTVGVANVGRYAYSLAPAGWRRISDLTYDAATFHIISTVPNVNAGWSQTWIDSTTPNRVEAGGINSSLGFLFGYSYGVVAADTLFSGQTSFTDNVWGLGWNLTTSWTPANANFGAPSIRIESRWKKAGRGPTAWPDGSEFHIIAMHTVGANAQENRMLSGWCPYHQADWPYDSDMNFRAAAWAMADGSGDIHVAFNWAGATGVGARPIALTSKVVFQKAGNDTDFATQQNAAGTRFWSLGRLDSHDQLAYELPSYRSFLSTDWLTNALGIYSADAISVGGAPNASRLRYLSFSSSAGTITDVETEGPASAVLEWKLRNTHASGRGGLTLSANGNSYLGLVDEANFRLSGMRLIPADGTLRIGTHIQGANYLGDAMVVQYATQQVQFPYAPQLPIYTFGTIPNVATAGNGALAAVSDRYALYIARAGVWTGVVTENLLHPGYVSGNYVWPTEYKNPAGGSCSPGINVVKLAVFSQDVPITVSELATRVTTPSATKLIQLAVYALDPTTHKPTGLPLMSTGTLSAATADAVAGAVTPALLRPGFYAVGVMTDNVGVAVLGRTTSVPGTARLVGDATLTNVTPGAASNGFGWTAVATFGTFPDLTGATLTPYSNVEPVVIFKAQ